MMNSTPSRSWKDNGADYEYENLYEYLREKSRILAYWDQEKLFDEKKKKQQLETRILL